MDLFPVLFHRKFERIVDVSFAIADTADILSVDRKMSRDLGKTKFFLHFFLPISPYSETVFFLLSAEMSERACLADTPYIGYQIFKKISTHSANIFTRFTFFLAQNAAFRGVYKTKKGRG